MNEETARAAEWQHEQEMLQQDPAFLQWLDQLDAERRLEHQLELETIRG